ncbi:MAG: methionyl-tRNA formyltransferase [Paracoccaceae bacterium]
MRVVFMGTPAFAVPALRALAGAHEVVCAYTQPPRPAGRGKRDRPSEVQVAAQALGIEVRHPTTLRDEAAIAGLRDLRADVAVVAAYGLILPQAALDAPARGCLNIHASLLPRWRGAAPIHRAIMAGDAETGVCIMGMEAGLDTGPVYARQARAIGPIDTTGELTEALAHMGAALTLDVLSRLDAIAPTPQPEAGVTYAAKIDKAEARIDWTRPAAQVARHVNGLSPHPGAWSTFRDTRSKLLRARASDEGTGAPGTILSTAPLRIACGAGSVEALSIQSQGARAQAPADWVNGARPRAQERFV